jgi:hypothetical protein
MVHGAGLQTGESVVTLSLSILVDIYCIGIFQIGFLPFHYFQLLNQWKFRPVQRMKMKLFYQQLVFRLVEGVVVGVVSQGFQAEVVAEVTDSRHFRYDFPSNHR